MVIEYDSGTARWESAWGGAVERVMGLPCSLSKLRALSASPHAHQAQSSPNPVFHKCYGGFIT